MGYRSTHIFQRLKGSKYLTICLPWNWNIPSTLQTDCHNTWSIQIMGTATWYLPGFRITDLTSSTPSTRARHTIIRRYLKLLQRHNEMARRERRRRRIMALAVVSMVYACMPQYTIWFEECVLLTYTDRQWQRNFWMKKATFFKLCDDLRDDLTKEHTWFKKPISVEKRVMPEIWRMATPCEFRTIAFLFP